MIGNRVDATHALVGNLRLLSDVGTDRIVYDGGNVVYKVERDGARYWEVNVNEVRNADSISLSLPPNVRIPAMSLHLVLGETVLAMERVIGIPTGFCTDEILDLPCSDGGTHMPKKLIKELSKIGFTDSCWGNVILSGDTYWIVDVAE